MNARRSSPDRRVTANRRTADKLAVRLRATAAMPEQVTLSLLDKPMTKTKIKTKTKKKPATGVVWAIKKGKRAAAFMPDEVVVLLDGEVTGSLLITCGWTMSTDAKDRVCRKWPLARLQKNLGRIEESWIEDVGKGWRLEIR